MKVAPVAERVQFPPTRKSPETALNDKEPELMFRFPYNARLVVVIVRSVLFWMVTLPGLPAVTVAVATAEVHSELNEYAPPELYIKFEVSPYKGGLVDTKPPELMDNVPFRVVREAPKLIPLES